MGKGDTWCYNLFGITEFIRLQQPGVVNLCDVCRFCGFFPNSWWCLSFCCGLNGGIAPGIQNFSGFQCANEGHGPTRHHRARQKQKKVEGPAQVTKLFELRKWLSQEMLPAKTCKVTANKKFISSKEIKHLRRICNLCPFKLRVNCISDALLSTHWY